jgi:hypothetical protein
MATRSTIAVIHEDGTVSQIYCHSDGYLSYNGQLLVDHYNSRLAAEFLVSKGDLSVLGKKVGQKLNFNDSMEYEDHVAKQCRYYGRDREETGTEPRVFNCVSDYKMFAQRQEYNYLFGDGEWVYQLEVNDPIMHSVAESLCDRNNVSEIG